MAFKPKPDTRYRLTFLDSIGTYSAGPFVFEAGKWVHDKDRSQEAEGKVVSYVPWEAK